MGRLFLLLVAGAVVLLGLTVPLAGRAVVLSAQVGYWSAALVVLASFGSYRRMVRQRLEAGMVADEGADRDVIDKLEDPFGLYDEEEASGGPIEEKSLRETIREEKARMKKHRRSPLATARDAVPAFSPWRLGAYGVLVLGFFLLRDRQLLHLGAYLASLALPIVLAVWFLMRTEARRAESA
jgi:hypothetical protein